MDNGGVFTNRLISSASIKEGSKALDIGCGSGDVTFRLAKAVGLSGHVSDVDLNKTVLSSARARAAELGITHVTFWRATFLTLLERTEI